MERKQKIFHANLLKRYLPADSEDPEVAPEPTELGEVSESSRESPEPTESESEAMMIQAVLWERMENPKDQGSELETLISLQKETIKDVKINPELSEAQQAEVRTLLEQYTDISLMFQVSPTSVNM